MIRLSSRAKAVLFLLGGLSIGVLLGLLIVAGGPGLAGGTTLRSQPPSVGSRVPDFVLETPGGDQVRLSEYKGRPVVINFWATWCAPCKEEMPLFESYAQKTSQEVVWLGVNSQEDKDTVNQFVQDLGVSFPVLLDTDGRVSLAYYVRAFPATFFVDEEGILRAQHIGQVNEAQLVGYLRTVGINP